jgi:putative transposase
LKIRQRRVSRQLKGSKNRKKVAKKLGLFHQKSGDKRQAYQWKTAHKIVDKNIDAIDAIKFEYFWNATSVSIKN